MPEMSIYYSDKKCKLCQPLRLADSESYSVFEQNHFKCVDCLRHPPSMVHWPGSAICLVVRVRSSSEEEKTQTEEFKVILVTLLMIYDVGVEYDHLPSESLSFCIKKFIFSWSKLSLLYVRPPLLKPLEHRNFRCPSTTEERREHTT